MPDQHESVAFVAKLARHAASLARAFDVKLIIVPSLAPHQAVMGILSTRGQPRSLVGRKGVRAAPVTDETTYACLLHELGHAVHPLGDLTTQYSKVFRDSLLNAKHPSAATFGTLEDVRLLLLSERSAWEWAKQYALDWTLPMEQNAQMSWRSYRQLAARFRIRGGKLW